MDASLANREHPVFTEAVHRARHTAHARLQRAAEGCGAVGVVGITTDLRLFSGSVAGVPIGGPGDRTCLCLAVGTAVRRVPVAEAQGAIPTVVPLPRPK